MFTGQGNTNIRNQTLGAPLSAKSLAQLFTALSHLQAGLIALRILV
jgi:hypothetical protein